MYKCKSCKDTKKIVLLTKTVDCSDCPESFTNKEGVYHGFFSAAYKKKFGSYFYISASDGKSLIETTLVCCTKEWANKNYKWDDVIYVGEVTKYHSSSTLNTKPLVM